MSDVRESLKGAIRHQEDNIRALKVPTLSADASPEQIAELAVLAAIAERLNDSSRDLIGMAEAELRRVDGDITELERLYTL